MKPAAEFWKDENQWWATAHTKLRLVPHAKPSTPSCDARQEHVPYCPGIRLLVFGHSRCESQCAILWQFIAEHFAMITKAFLDLTTTLISFNDITHWQVLYTFMHWVSTKNFWIESFPKNLLKKLQYFPTQTICFDTMLFTNWRIFDWIINQ